MIRRLWPLIVAAGVLAMALLLSACGDDVTTEPDPCGRTWGGYRPCNETPEAVLNNLVVSYRRREIEKYAELLDPDFRFYFQDGDEPADLGRDYWTAAEDSTGTAALFNSPEVTDIYIDLTYSQATAGTVDRSPDPLMWIRVTPMKLTVDDISGWTLLVEGDIQDFFFVRGAGTDSVSWYLYEWHDIPGGRGISSPGEGVLAGAVQPTSWGMIKALY